MNQKFKECLSEVYLGEQAGEMIFESMLAMAEDDNQRYIFSNMPMDLPKRIELADVYNFIKQNAIADKNLC